MNSLRICLLGYGNVGRGFFNLVKNLNNEDIQIVKVFEREKRKEMLGELFVGSIDEFVNDKNINVVVECLGGDTTSYEAITKSLKAGKSVVTSNKETVSLHLDEYLSLAKQNNCHFRFEASVGGGIPLINTMQHLLTYDKINSFFGIVNGTTNYIITKIMEDKIDFDAALKQAQEKGFAEADPSADLMGLDMVRKGAILSSLAYGVAIDVNDIPHYGIENLSKEIINDIRNMNLALKLCVSSSYADNVLSLGVIPLLIKKEDALNGIKYEFNGVSLSCKDNDVITLIGKGAGGTVTGCAIMQDIMDIYQGKADVVRENATKVKNNFSFRGKYYICNKKGRYVVDNPSKFDFENLKFIAKIM